MNKRALVVGSQVGELTGVATDAREIAKRLDARGFRISARTGADASRAGILQGLRELVEASRADDAVVFHYSGHGGYFVNPQPRAGQPSVLQCLIGTDWSTSQEFAGVTDAELSRLLGELTAKTKNVTVVLDCCHSSRMMRQAQADRRLRMLSRSWDERLDAFLRAHPAGNSARIGADPHAVRIAASEQDRSAFESLHLVDGRLQSMGNLTHALVEALDELGDTPLSWRALFGRVREKVMEREPGQRPELGGPSDRVLFTLQSASSITELAPVVYYLDGGVPAVRASRLLGARPNETEYWIFARDTTSYEPSQALAKARVLALVPGGARVELLETRRPPQVGDLAIPTVSPFPRLPLDLVGPRDQLLAVESQLAQRRVVRLVEPDEEPALTVRVGEAGGLALDDEDGNTLLHVATNDDAGARALLTRAEGVSRARALKGLSQGDLPETAIRVHWSRIVGKERVPITDRDTLYSGDHFCVEVENCSTSKLWIALYDVGVTSNVQLITTDAPNGYVLQPAGSGEESWYRLGVDSEGRGTLPLCWAEDAEPSLTNATESVVVIACDDQADFSLLAAPPASTRRGALSELEGMLAALREGKTRDWPPRQRQGARYRKLQLEFFLEREPREQLALLTLRGVEASSGRREQRTIERLRPQDLCPGDVLLSSGSAAISEAIKGLDGGWYSHAALWTGESVIDSSDPGVCERPLAEALSDRVYLDVYRRPNFPPAEQMKVVAEARKFLGRHYAYGDLFLACSILASGSFLFRGSVRAQQWWLWAANECRSRLDKATKAKNELVTCSELVARSFAGAGLFLSINLNGLREYKGPELYEALKEFVQDHLSVARAPGSLADVLAELQQQYLALRGGELAALLPTSEGAQPRRLPAELRAGKNWDVNLVTPRDLMQSPDLDLVGQLPPLS